MPNPGTQWRLRATPTKTFTVVGTDSYGLNIRVAWHRGGEGYMNSEEFADLCEPLETTPAAPAPQPREIESESEVSSPLDYDDGANFPPPAVIAANPTQTGTFDERINQVRLQLEGLSISDAIRLLDQVRVALFETTIIRRTM